VCFGWIEHQCYFDRLLAAVKKIVSHFSHRVGYRFPQGKAESNENNDAKKLINNCATRWNFTYECLHICLSFIGLFLQYYLMSPLQKDVT